MERFSYLKSANAAFIDELLERYLADPESVDSSWRYFFEGLDFGTSSAVAPGATPQAEVAAAGPDLSSEAKVAELITAYRELGRLLADINPLAPPPASHPLLELARFGLSDADLNRSFTAARLVGMEPAPLSQILTRLRETYCGSVGVEFTHIQDRSEREWLRSKMETSRNRIELDSETRKFILKRLTQSESFERFLHTRYVAQKRFSVEGGEAVIPALDCMIEASTELGAEQFVIGMAHRGRLNVLANVFGKKPEYIFTEFEGTYTTDPSQGEGDVKYHMGYSTDHVASGGRQVHLSLASNPSHLEFVNPVVEGMVRAKQTYLDDSERRKVIPILIHGDASFAGQGVCYETLNLAGLSGYSTGGTLHIVINNQIGFTALPGESRSTTYSTDLAKMLEVPIFHVNGDDPEAVWYVARLCSEYRARYRKDAFMDLICYRKHGHNEGDEPGFTQPVMARQIKAHASPREIYAGRLVAQGVLDDAKAKALVDEELAKLLDAQKVARARAPHPAPATFGAKWEGLKAGTLEDMLKPVNTAVPAEQLVEIAEKANRVPDSFKLHPKLARFLEARLRTVRDGKSIDWGNGESLAYATLLLEGHAVRLSGQDSERGTFTHRHAVLHDFESGETYLPLNKLRDGQARFEVYNSHLAEIGVLGFEFGYALADPSALVIWEAQFGDFANGAQVIIDQFIASAESKWARSSGLVLLLPHGFEGQGPEHSSARLERFLQLCAKGNMAVANLTTPAQLFHALRRQVRRDFRKPLVIMSPKSLLRHSQAVSEIGEFSRSRFQEVLDDPVFSDVHGGVRKVLLCSGKIYYDLLLERGDRTDIALVRIEQLYPWPGARLEAILKRYPAAEVVWVQEEPRNMGAWPYIFAIWAGGSDDFGERAGKGISYVGRDFYAAPAVGSAKQHEKEQKALIAKAFSDAGERGKK
ncbi:MAG: 2-oxoglutarate dehydrogenase E1 component [Bdellovibrionales bacterium GWB1_55_8]|nr:MAG: 2-oxoglutarate dehydrogenase E1 component [Bdellovibrionales bacterium GWB1_55_8]